MKTSTTKGLILFAVLMLSIVGSVAVNRASAVTAPVPTNTTTKTSKPTPYNVVKVIDGDTVDVMVNGKKERIRMIGVNTPETVDPRKPVECFGKEASNKAKSLLVGKKVSLEKDDTQGDRDKYSRLLRYVVLADGTNVNLSMIKEGYAYEYTYNLPYKYQSDFKNAQKLAMDQKKGLWGATCQKTTSGAVKKPTNSTATPSSPVSTVTPPAATSIPSNNSCTIKGNISSSKEKIFHVPGCQSYSKTVIDESAGEKWFCSESEAIQAGWRKALNC